MATGNRRVKLIRRCIAGIVVGRLQEKQDRELA
jgi:hypothetical protein